MEKIDLCASIIERFALTDENNAKLQRLSVLFRYFIKDNIENLFGRNEFDADELEIVRVKEGLVIDSIFGMKIYIKMTQDGDYRIVAKDANSDTVFFSIYMSETQAINECFVDEHSYKYEIDMKDDRFSYSAMDEHQETEFEAYLQPLGAKRNTFEIFEYKRMIPEQTEIKTLFGRIIEKINGDGLVKLDTGSTIIDVVNHAEIIFDKLKKEAKKEKEHQLRMEKQGN